MMAMMDRAYWSESLKALFKYSRVEYQSFVFEMAREASRRQLDPQSEEFYLLVDTALRSRIRGEVVNEAQLVVLYDDIRREIPVKKVDEAIRILNARFQVLKTRSFPGKLVGEADAHMIRVAEVLLVAQTTGVLTMGQKQRVEESLNALQKMAVRD